MMKYLEGEEITVDELKAGIRKATVNAEFILYCAVPHLKTKVCN